MGSTRPHGVANLEPLLDERRQHQINEDRRHHGHSDELLTSLRRLGGDLR
jgi:hypothetical protein